MSTITGSPSALNSSESLETEDASLLTSTLLDGYRPTHPPDFIPTRDDQLTWMGYQLGLTGQPCPSILDIDMTGSDWMAALSGYVRGDHEKYAAECMVWAEMQVLQALRGSGEEMRFEPDNETDLMLVSHSHEELTEVYGSRAVREMGGEL